MNTKNNNELELFTKFLDIKDKEKFNQTNKFYIDIVYKNVKEVFEKKFGISLKETLKHFDKLIEESKRKNIF